MQSFIERYKSIFSLSEIEASKVLQWAYGAMLLAFYATFNGWIGGNAITKQAYQAGSYECWPWFQTCGEWFVHEALPYGYSQSIFYMVLFGMMVGAVYFMWKRDWFLAHVYLTILFLWKFLVVFVLTSDYGGNYDYYHLILTAILLFFPHKLFFLKVTFVWLYFLAATIKIHEGWILGTYMTTLKTGLPIFGNMFAPIITNVVIFMQVVGAWFLLSRHYWLQRATIAYMAWFHLYSGILVEYMYPTTVLPILLILFGPMYTDTKIPRDRKSLVGYTLLVVLLCSQFISVLIPGDVKLTLEGNRYGLYMFEANHQCFAEWDITRTDGSVEAQSMDSGNARHRCEPYMWWFALNELCRRDEAIESIALTFDHSINGGLFYRIVDEPDICGVGYEAFGHNDWIRTPETGAVPVGRAVKNVYY